MACIYREYFRYFKKTVFIVCEFRDFLQFCITGVNRTLILWFSKISANFKSRIKHTSMSVLHTCTCDVLKK